MKYEDVGVSIERGENFVSSIKHIVESTNRPEVMTLLGGFNGAFRLPTGYEKPVLIASTDGVGSKIKLSVNRNAYNVGIDLAAMSINDVITSGAKPMFFLDYIACHSIETEKLTSIVHGISYACKISNCTLLGGETAEMPSIYPPEEIDLAGFCVGIVEEEKRITGENISEGDKIVGLSSFGPHANGYALINALLEEEPFNFPFLDFPTRVYTQEVFKFCGNNKVLGMAHITGGGLENNINRILPPGLCANIDWNNPRLSPKWAETIAQRGNVPTEEMRSVFNMGIGYVFVVPSGANGYFDSVVGTVVKSS